MLDETTNRLVARIQEGLPLTPRPFATLARELEMSETEVMERIRALQDEGMIKRFGVVVRHHELGYRANAMVVWDIPDHEVSAAGRRLSELECVTLCYRRPRRPPLWPYNLFSMIHGKSRQSVLARIEEIARDTGLAGVPREVLFSGRRFKQRGARYVRPDAETAHRG